VAVEASRGQGKGRQRKSSKRRDRPPHARAGRAGRGAARFAWPDTRPCASPRTVKVPRTLRPGFSVRLSRWQSNYVILSWIRLNALYRGYKK